ncbi:MAG: pseudaminic acid biosynthesis-associated methylase [Caulobacter sp.]
MASVQPKPLSAWTGAFGDAYTERNALSADAQRARVHMLAKSLAPIQADPLGKILEVGTNQGLNLRVLPGLTGAELWGIEPNASARELVVSEGVLPAERMLAGFGHEIPMADGAVDLAFTSGVLIHVDPSLLEQTMREIHRVSSKYILCIEYFASKPETISYRGEEGLLFKRDFGGMYLDLFPDLQVVDYGFFWKRATMIDDSTWWLFRKAGA